MNNGRNLFWHSLLVNLSRLILASALIFSGSVKIIDPRGTEYKIADYIAGFGLAEWSFQYLALIAAVALGATEFCMGTYLLFGVRRKLTSRLVLAIFLCFTPLTFYLALTDVVHECGCFGDVLVLSNWQTFAKNLVLLSCSCVLAAWPRKQTSLVSIPAQWMVGTYSWVYSIVLAIYSIYTIPVMDFTQYRLGFDLVRKTMWKSDGTVPAITDLQIYDTKTYEDLTDSVISSSGWKFLIIAPQLGLADDGVMDKLAELTDYCNEHGYMLRCLTQSDIEEIEYWCDITGAEYEFCTVDEVVLKTMVRSNPGLLMLHNGVIKGKWAASQLPGMDELTAPVEHTQLVQVPSSNRQRFLALVMWFLLPMLILTLLDRILFGFRMYRTRRDRIIYFKKEKK